MWNYKYQHCSDLAIGWVIIIGDGIHNIADGLAIGAAFSDSIILGIAQAIAVACQEFPSELGLLSRNIFIP